MADSSMMPALIAATAGLLGSAIGIGGTLLVQLRVERQKQHYDKAKETRRRKEDKLEELASALYAHEYWFIQAMNAIKQGETNLQSLLAKLPPPPFAQLQAIGSIHFPDFQNDITALSFESAKLANSLLAGSRINIDNYLPYSKLVRGIEERIRDYAERNFQ